MHISASHVTDDIVICCLFAQFAVYEYMKTMGEKLRSLSDQEQVLQCADWRCDELTLMYLLQPALISAGIGGASKIVASVATYPYQVIKSKLQQADTLHSDTNTYRAKYSSTWDCATQIWR